MQIVNVSFCTGVASNIPLLTYICDVVPRFVLSASLLSLAVIKTLKQSIQMYKATKQWQPNKYMQQLVNDGVFYFLVYVFPSCLSFQKADQLDISPEPLGMCFSTLLLYCKQHPRSTVLCGSSYPHFATLLYAP